MNTRALVIFSGMAVLLSFPQLAESQTIESAQQGWTVPRTPDGHPDLQGVWGNNTATPLERPEMLVDKAVLSDEEVASLQAAANRLHESGGDAAFGDGVFQAALANVESIETFDGGTGNYSTAWMVERNFDNRTSLIIDPKNGRLPAMTDEAKERQAEAFAGMLGSPNGPEDLMPQIRCITYGVPRVGGLGAGYNSYYQIFQSAGYVAIYSEMIHDVRLIPLDSSPHVSDGIRQWHGDSRGHWEGDSLVVETRNFSGRSSYQGSADNLHLTERFIRVGPDLIHYEITVEDASTWSQPWTAMTPLTKTNSNVFEYACQEGNYSLEGILAGARVEEKQGGGGSPVR